MSKLYYGLLSPTLMFLLIYLKLVLKVSKYYLLNNSLLESVQWEKKGGSHLR